MHSKRRGPARAGGLTAAVAALITGLSACAGGSGSSAGGDNDFVEQSAAEIQQMVVADMATLESVRMTGELLQDGQEIGIDLSLNSDGVCAGSLSVTGGNAELIAGPGGQYLKGDQAFWSGAAGGEGAAAQVSALLGEKWAKLPEGEGGFTSICDLDDILAEFGSVDAAEGEATIGKQEEIEGVAALELISKDDTPTTAWVAVAAPHYIVKVTAEGKDAGSIVFSDFNEAVEVEAPPPSDVIDLSKF